MAKKQAGRPKRARKTALTSVYPRPFAPTVLGGTGSRVMNLAIECWAVVLARATEANAGLLSAQEWRLLARAYREMERKPEPSDPAPQEWLIALVVGAGNVFGELFPAKARGSLVSKLEGLDYIRAWAVIYAVQWAVDSGHADEEAEWWTVAFRGTHQAASGKN